MGEPNAGLNPLSLERKKHESILFGAGEGRRRVEAVVTGTGSELAVGGTIPCVADRG